MPVILPASALPHLQHHCGVLKSNRATGRRPRSASCRPSLAVAARRLHVSILNPLPVVVMFSSQLQQQVLSPVVIVTCASSSRSITSARSSSGLGSGNSGSRRSNRVAVAFSARSGAAAGGGASGGGGGGGGGSVVGEHVNTGFAEAAAGLSKRSQRNTLKKHNQSAPASALSSGRPLFQTSGPASSTSTAAVCKNRGSGGGDKGGDGGGGGAPGAATAIIARVGAQLGGGSGGAGNVGGSANNILPTSPFNSMSDTGRSASRHRALVLDCAYRPINVISWSKAVTMDMSEKAETLVFYPPPVKAVSGQGDHNIPAVVRVPQYVADIEELCSKVACTRRNIMVRDAYTCQYCGSKHNLTLDHVLPLCKGGRDGWQNLVTACTRCNQKKGGHLLKEIGWKLRVAPREPSPFEIGIVAGVSAQDMLTPPEEWLYFIQPYREKLQQQRALAEAAGEMYAFSNL